MQKSKFLLLVPFALLAVSCNPQAQIGVSQIGSTVTIGKTEIAVELAQTPKERSKGLMHRTSLPEDEGMLFIFEEPGIYPFWMKDTFIPLDIIWILDNEIVHIEKQVPPGKGLFPPAYSSESPANFVLEVNAGVAEASDWKVGDSVLLSF